MKKLWVMVVLVGCTEVPVADPGTDPAPDAGSPTAGPTTDFTEGAQPDNPFFAALGTNDRTCASCHDVAVDWSVTPRTLQARFDQSQGLDPVFRPVDGATAPTADVSTLAARRTAYALLLARGVFRIGRPVPDGLVVSAIDDPYGYASAGELSLFRRPLPSTNLRFEQTIMWDGREPSLAQQAIDATLGHAEATQTPTAQVDAIVAFESSLYTAQSFDPVAGELSGPVALAAEPFAAGPAGSFTLYADWVGSSNARRAAIAHGEQLFDTHRFQIRGAVGIPDQPGTCSTCHDTSNVGNHHAPLFVNLGVAAADRRTPQVPLYTFTNPVDGRTAQTTDPGLALTTGQWNDLGRFKVPGLRAVALRAPYFHDGSAPDLGAVVQFYDRRFDLRLSPTDRRDLVAFLESL